MEFENYSQPTSKLRRIIKSGVIGSINSNLFYPERHIIDINIKDSRIEFNKRKYLNVEITLFTKIKESILSNIIKDDTIRFINDILTSMEKSNYFEFTVSKKKYEPAL
jgi:hypothetical protein